MAVVKQPPSAEWPPAITPEKKRYFILNIRLRNERLYDILEEARVYVRTAEWDKAYKAARYPNQDFTIRLWRKLNILNGVTCLRIEVDSITGASNPHWAHIVPASEVWIPEEMFWLRANNVLPMHSGKLEWWRISFYNVIPLPTGMGRDMEYEIGGLVLIATKKCLWRMCMFGILALMRWAQITDAAARQKFKDFSPKDLLLGWTEQVASIQVSGLAIGRAYFEEFKDDYSLVQLQIDNAADDEDRERAAKCELSSSKVPSGIEKYPGYDEMAGKKDEITPIYEYHWIVTKPRLDQGTDYIDRRTTVNGELLHEVVTYERHVGPDGRQRIPTDTIQRRFPARRPAEEKEYLDRDPVPILYESGRLLPVGPTFLVPSDPLPTIKHFDGTIRRLLEVESYYIEEGSEMQQIMDLAELFLRLAQCGTPADLWRIPIPEWLGGADGLPEMPKNVNTVQRVHFIREEMEFNRKSLDKKGLEELNEERKAFAQRMGQKTLAESRSITSCQVNNKTASQAANRASSDAALQRQSSNDAGPLQRSSSSEAALLKHSISSSNKAQAEAKTQALKDLAGQYMYSEGNSRPGVSTEMSSSISAHEAASSQPSNPHTALSPGTTAPSLGSNGKGKNRQMDSPSPASSRGQQRPPSAPRPTDSRPSAQPLNEAFSSFNIRDSDSARGSTSKSKNRRRGGRGAAAKATGLTDRNSAPSASIGGRSPTLKPSKAGTHAGFTPRDPPRIASGSERHLGVPSTEHGTQSVRSQNTGSSSSTNPDDRRARRPSGGWPLPPRPAAASNASSVNRRSIRHCTNCGYPGHIAKDCPVPRKKGGCNDEPKGGKKDDDDAGAGGGKGARGGTGNKNNTTTTTTATTTSKTVTTQSQQNQTGNGQGTQKQGNNQLQRDQIVKDIIDVGKGSDTRCGEDCQSVISSALHSELDQREVLSSIWGMHAYSSRCSEDGTSSEDVPKPHVPDDFALYGLELEAGILTLEAKVKFETAIQEHGHYEALDRLRLHKGGLGRDNETFARLLSEMKLIKEGHKIRCTGRCFDEIRGDVVASGESGVDLTPEEAQAIEAASCLNLKAPLIEEISSTDRTKAWIASVKDAEFPMDYKKVQMLVERTKAYAALLKSVAEQVPGSRIQKDEACHGARPPAAMQGLGPHLGDSVIAKEKVHKPVADHPGDSVQDKHAQSYKGPTPGVGASKSHTSPKKQSRSTSNKKRPGQSSQKKNSTTAKAETPASAKPYRSSSPLVDRREVAERSSSPWSQTTPSPPPWSSDAYELSCH